MVELVFGEHAILRAIPEGFLDDLQHLFVGLLRTLFVVVGAIVVGGVIGIFVTMDLPMTWLSFAPINSYN